MIPEGEKAIKYVFDEIIAENYPYLKKKSDIQIQKAQRVPNKMNPNKSTPRRIIKTAEVRQDSKGSKRKTVNYKGTAIRLSVDCSTEMMQARREWQSMFKV